MRIFILCTGRSGSVSIIKACNYITNYTSSHESLTKALGEKRFDYPENHIEADNRLSWHLGYLDKLFGDEAFYVHLKRDRDKVAHSLLRRYYIPESIIDSFCEGIRMLPSPLLSKEQRLQACYDYVDTITTNIEHFLSNKTNTMTINLENITEDFPKFWNKINAEGNLEEALNVFDKPFNPSSKRKLNYKYRLKLLLIKEWRHLAMCFNSKKN